MATTLTIDEAQTKFRDVVVWLRNQDEVAITGGDQVVARIVGARPTNGLAQAWPGE